MLVRNHKMIHPRQFRTYKPGVFQILRIPRTSTERANPTKNNLALLLVGAFGKIPKRDYYVTPCVSVRRSVPMELGSHWMEFH